MPTATSPITLSSVVVVLCGLPGLAWGQPTDPDLLKIENTLLRKINARLNREVNVEYCAKRKLELRHKKELKKHTKQIAQLERRATDTRALTLRREKKSHRKLVQLQRRLLQVGDQRDQRLARLVEELGRLRRLVQAGQPTKPRPPIDLDRRASINMHDGVSLSEILDFLCDVTGSRIRLAKTDADLGDLTLWFRLRAPLRDVLNTLAASHPTLSWRRDKTGIVFFRKARRVSSGWGRSRLDLAFGTGARADPGKTITIHYVGRRKDGKVFDSSRQRKTPARFVVGSGDHVWAEGLVGMKVGGKRRLTLAPEAESDTEGPCPMCAPTRKLTKQERTLEVELLKVE